MWIVGFGEACLDMGPYESEWTLTTTRIWEGLRRLYTSIARKQFQDEPTEKQPAVFCRRSLRRETIGHGRAERLGGVEYKYNKRDARKSATQFRLLSLEPPVLGQINSDKPETKT